jgi:hypothetical protein
MPCIYHVYSEGLYIPGISQVYYHGYRILLSWIYGQVIAVSQKLPKTIIENNPMLKQEMIRKRNSPSKLHIKNTLYIHDIYQVYAWYIPYIYQV